MRRPTCSTTLAKRQPAQKPKFSQRSGRQDFTLGGMSVSQLRRARQTQGIALVIVLLSAMILMVSLLAISATMTISSQRTTADQSVTLPAQYAAEAGVARAYAGLKEAQGVLGTLKVEGNRTTLEAHLRNYCNVTASLPIPANPDNTPFCIANTGTNANRYSLFTSSTPSAAYPSGTTAATYWTPLFERTPVTTQIASSGSSKTSYTVSYGLIPKGVLVVKPNFYRLEFDLAPVDATGNVQSGNTVVASRRIQQTSGGTYSVDVQVPSFARNFVFRNKTTSTSGGQLYFAGGESFNGPVHTNGIPGFYKTGGQTPTFSSDFTTCSGSGAFYGYSGGGAAGTADYQSTFQGSAQFTAECVPMPTNSNNQKRASFGGDTTNTVDLTDEEMQTAWGVKYTTTTTSQQPVPGSKNKCYNGPNVSGCSYTTTTTTTSDPLPNGIYYSKGDGATTPNQSTSWTNNATNNTGGGMYIKGDVDQVKLCSNSGNNNLQIIGIKQGSTTTTFQENTDGTWSVRVKSNGTVSCNVSSSSNTNGSEVKKLGGKFNGMVYVDGKVADLSGDGSDAADISKNSKITLTAAGDVTIKQDLTYTEDPQTVANAKNVLGIYSSGGSVLVDGPSNKDLNIHASIMASKSGEGFGATHWDQVIGTVAGQKVRINLLGGVIEDQSQTVGTIGNAGYARNYKYDPRFKNGYAPPFYPEQVDGITSSTIVSWTSSVTPFGTQRGVWQTVSK